MILIKKHFIYEYFLLLFIRIFFSFHYYLVTFPNVVAFFSSTSRLYIISSHTASRLYFLQDLLHFQLIIPKNYKNTQATPSAGLHATTCEISFKHNLIQYLTNQLAIFHHLRPFNYGNVPVLFLSKKHQEWSHLANSQYL